MKEYLKRLLIRKPEKINVDVFPKYYEDSELGCFVKETSEGKFFEVKINEKKEVEVVRQIFKKDI